MSLAILYQEKYAAGESDRTKGRGSREIRLIGCSGDREPLRKGLLIARRDFNLWCGPIKRRGVWFIGWSSGSRGKSKK